MSAIRGVKEHGESLRGRLQRAVRTIVACSSDPVQIADVTTVPRGFPAFAVFWE